MIQFWRIGSKVKNDRKLFDKAFYTKKVLDKAILDYRQIASIKISDKDKYWECAFESNKMPIEIIINEFDNYLIELLNGNII